MCLLKDYCEYYEDGNCPGSHEAFTAICKNTGMQEVVENLLEAAGTSHAPILVGEERESTFLH